MIDDNFKMSQVLRSSGVSKDLTNGIRNSMESNWQLNQALNPNNPSITYSNFDVRNRLVSTVNYHLNWDEKNLYTSHFSLFFSASSGLPYTLGMVGNTINGSPQQVSLLYVPKSGETTKFFANTEDGLAQAKAFDDYIDGDKYLKTRRGNFTERNAARTPWNVQADFRFAQDINFLQENKKANTLTFTFDILNLTNLLKKNWGIQYFAPNTFNSTSSMGLKLGNAGTATQYPTYSFNGNSTTNYAKDFFASRWQMQFGLRYSF